MSTSWVGDLSVEAGHLRGDDLPLALGVGVVEVQVEAAALERLGQLAGGVGGEHHERPARRGHACRARGWSPGSPTAPPAAGPRPRRRSCRPRRRAAPSGSSRRIAVSSGRVSRNSSVKMSSWVSSHARSSPLGLDAQQLLLVVPLVERARLVEPLVALQPDQLGAGRPRHRLGQLGLADAGRALDQQRLLQRSGEVRRGGGRRVGEVAGGVQPGGGVGGGGEPGGHGASLGARPGSATSGDPATFPVAGVSLPDRPWTRRTTTRRWAVTQPPSGQLECGSLTARGRIATYVGNGRRDSATLAAKRLAHRPGDGCLAAATPGRRPLSPRLASLAWQRGRDSNPR